MLITIQFPISDARPFLGKPLRLERPLWPIPLEGEEFVRGFGGIKARRLGGLGNWVGENAHCHAEKVVRFEGATGSLTGQSAKLSLKVSFRRLFADGVSMAKFEVGLGISESAAKRIEAWDLGKLVSEIASLKASVSGSKPAAGLISAGKQLAEAYEVATALRGVGPDSKALVKHSKPVIVVESKATINLSPGFKIVPIEDEYCQVALGLHRLENGMGIPVWIISPIASVGQSSSRYSAIRALRVCILRLHAEYQCFQKTVQTALATGIAANTSECQALQTFLNKTVRKITRLEQSADEEFSDEALTKAIRAQAALSPDLMRDAMDLLSKLEIRRNVYRKTEEFLLQQNAYYMNQDLRNANVVGSVVGAGMENVTVSKVNSKIDIVKAQTEVSKLAEELKKILPSLEPEKAAEAAKGLETLQAGVNSPPADPKWWELSLKGIKDAAKSVAAISGPVLATVDTLKELFEGAVG